MQKRHLAIFRSRTLLLRSHYDLLASLGVGIRRHRREDVRRVDLAPSRMASFMIAMRFEINTTEIAKSHLVSGNSPESFAELLYGCLVFCYLNLVATPLSKQNA